MSNTPDRKVDPFAPWTLRGIELRNRLINAGTHEGHCPGSRPDREGLAAFHEAFARGSAGLYTVSYGSVEPGGCTFDDQTCLQEDNLDDLTYVTGKIHAHCAKAAIQLAHRSGMSKWSGGSDAAHAGPQHTHDAVDHASAVHTRDAARLVRQQRFDHAPLEVGQVIAVHRQAPAIWELES